MEEETKKLDTLLDSLTSDLNNLSLSEKSLTPEEKLSSSAYQFGKLYERWAEDRHAFALDRQKFNQVLDAYLKGLKAFHEIKSEIETEAKKAIQNSVESMGQSLKEQVLHSASQKIVPVYERLKNTAEHAEKTLLDYESVVKKSQWKILLYGFVGSILTAILIAFFLIPKPAILTPQQISDLRDGQAMRELWPNFTKQQQETIRQVLEYGYQKRIKKNKS